MAETDRSRICIIILGIMIYMIIMFPPVDYKGIGRVYALLDWKGSVAWEQLLIEVAAAAVITGIIRIFPRRRRGK